MFHDVVRWMLQRDLLVTLHLRVRTVVPAALKARARRRRDERRDREWHREEEGAFRSRSRRGHKVRGDSGVSKTDLELFDPSPAWYMRRNAGAVDPPIFDEGIDLDEEIEKRQKRKQRILGKRRRMTMGHRS
jgi:nitrogen permease regulator 3-like protein